MGASLNLDLVCLGADGKPDFHALRPRITGGHTGPAATFIAFDVPHLDGHATRCLLYHERRQILTSLMAPTGPCWRIPEPLPGLPADVVAVIRHERVEGVIAKHLDHRYQPGNIEGPGVCGIPHIGPFTVWESRPV